AATELALLVGAQRADVCLTGNGKRSGNVDGITLALNIYSQSISPGLDFSQLGEVLQVVTDCTKIPVHPRTPYSGQLVYTAFSGAHQDGIAKGFCAMKERHVLAEANGKPKTWKVLYLPVDPTDFGLAYQAIRVNSQSGKGGAAHLIRQALNLDPPKSLQAEFHKVIQGICDGEGREMSASEIISLFTSMYGSCKPERMCASTLAPLHD
ncbi:hypothetical protein B0H14DRAFT_2392386, partial [Mycena olivaceomarginata]